jgi:micrococcal nuclease
MVRLYLYKIANVLKVVDGDTLDLEIDLGLRSFVKHRIRLIGIDTAELKSPDEVQRAKALAAMHFVSEWLDLNREKGLMIETFKSDVYGRWLGKIFPTRDERDSLNAALLHEGLAVRWQGRRKSLPKPEEVLGLDPE